MIKGKRYSPRQRRQSRRVLLQALYQWELAQPSLSTIQEFVKTEGSLDNADQEFFDDCLSGIIDQVHELDGVFEPYLDRPVVELTVIERGCLRAGCYEVINRPDVPNNVAISEWVRLAKDFGAQNSFRYINAVLDTVAKNFSVQVDE